MAKAPQVAVCAPAVDARAAFALHQYLADDGIHAELRSLADDLRGIDAVILVVSAAGVVDPGLASFLAGLGSTRRLVPVTVGVLDPQAAPSRIAELNWIPLDGDVGPAARAAWAAASLTAAQYDTSQAFEMRLEGWLAGGRLRDDLLTNRSELRGLTAARRVDPELVSEEGELFFRLSRTRVRRLALRRWASRAVGLVVVLSLIGATTSLVHLVRQLGEQDKLNEVVSATNLDSHAETQAIKFAAFLTYDGVDPDLVRLARQQLVASLAQPWPRALSYVTPGKMAINDVAYVNGGPTQLWAGGDGAVWLSNPIDGSVDQVGALSDGPLYEIAASSDGKSIAAADADTLYLLPGDTAIPAGGAIQDLSITDDGRFVTVSRAHGYSVIDTSGAAPHVMASGYRGEVLDVAGSDHPLGLLARGTRPAVVDLVDGHVVAPLPSEAIGRDSHADIDGSGQVVVVDPDGRIWWARPGRPLVVTSVRSVSPSASVELVGDGQVVISSYDEGARLVDLVGGTALGEVCSRSFPRGLVASQNGEWLSCLRGDLVMWNLDDLRPKSTGTADVEPTTSSASGATSAEVLDSGVLRLSYVAGDMLFAAGGSSLRRDVFDLARYGAGGHIAAVQVAPGGRSVLVGTSTGDVLEIDVADDGLSPVAAWEVPDREPMLNATFSGGTALVHTATATWQAPWCEGCTDSTALVLRAFRERMLPCYASTITDIVDPSRLRYLGASLCPQ